ncbi:MAG: Clp protease N-terminal domain-containing protein [Planctomycetota bacterium]|jgi:ATP-dependent Clp protease ATP-binding subunit ClpA
MFDRFTDRARKVMGLARQEAQRFGHDFIGTEHILLGVVQDETGVPARALRSFGITLMKVRLEVERQVHSGDTTRSVGQLPFTPRAKKALELAMDKAGKLRHNYIGTEHLFLGLLKEQDGMAARVLTGLGLKLEELRNRVLNFIVVRGPKERNEYPSLELDGEDTMLEDDGSDEVLPDLEEITDLPEVFDRLTDRARRVLGLARQEVQRFCHDYIGTEHILLGVVQEEKGVAASVLRNMGIALKKVRLEVERQAHSGDTTRSVGQLPFTPRAKKVLELSKEEAGDLGYTYIGTEHLLLGLLKEQDGMAARVLFGLGLQLEDVREQVLLLLNAEVPEDTGDDENRVHKLPVPQETFETLLNEANKIGEESPKAEHALLALLHFDDVESLKSEPRGIRELVYEILGVVVPEDGGEMRVRNLPVLKEIFEAALNEANKLGEASPKAEHVLLALLRFDDPALQRIFKELGVTYEGVLRRVLKTGGQET